jgi:hypothetical protein
MKEIERYDVQICGLCLHAHESPNAGTYTAEEETRALDTWARNWPGFTFVSTDDDGGFSWAGCDGCDNRKGQHLYAAYAIKYAD